MVNERIGFIGLGVMGAPMARNLAAAAYAVSVFDSDSQRARAVATPDSGLSLAGSAAELAGRCDIVITMLPNGNVVRRIVAGEGGIGGIADLLPPGSLLLDTSSSEPGSPARPRKCSPGAMSRWWTHRCPARSGAPRRRNSCSWWAALQRSLPASSRC